MTRGRNETESDLIYATQVTRVILQLIGAWPPQNDSSFISKTLIRLLNVLCYFLFFATLVPGLLRIFLVEKSARMRLKIFGPVLSCFMSLVKYTLLLYRSEEMKAVVSEMREDYRKPKDPRNRGVMLSNARIGRQLGILSAVLMYGGGLSHRTIIPLSKGRIVTPDNVTIRVLSCPSYFVKFDEQASPAYEIVFTIQLFAGILLFSVTCGGCSLAACYVLHACSQLKILAGKMVQLSEGNDFDEGSVGKRIAEIVRDQIRIKRFLSRVDAVIQYVCLVEIIGCSCLICIVGYTLLMEWERSDFMGLLTYLVVLISFTFSVFVFCYIGQLLNDQGYEVAMTSSAIDWYQFPVKKARCIVLIIAISHIPTKVVAGKMVEMSFSSFSSILKASVGYFNIIRKTMI